MSAIERTDDLRKIGPLSASHPLVTHKDICSGCSTTFKVGDFVTLIAIGPGNDPEQQELARMNQPYNAVAIAAHWACVTGNK